MLFACHVLQLMLLADNATITYQAAVACCPAIPVIPDGHLTEYDALAYGLVEAAHQTPSGLACMRKWTAIACAFFKESPGEASELN